MKQKLHSKENWGLFLLRFGLGVVFAVHGFDKLMNFGNTVEYIGNVGFPAAQFFTVLLIIVELGGGIALIIGLYTRVAAALVAALMVITILLVKGQDGFLGSAEFDFMLFFAALAVLLLGPGGLRLRFMKGVENSKTPSSGMYSTQEGAYGDESPSQ